MQIRQILILALAMAFSISVQAQKKVRLRLNLEAGKTYKVYNLIDQTISQNVMGTDQEILQAIGMGYDMEVLSATKKTFDVKVTYRKIFYEQSAMNVETKYDSENPPEEIPPAAIGYAGLLNQHFFMTMDRNGAIVDLRGIDELFDGMIEEMEKDGRTLPEGIRTQLKSQFGTEAMMSGMQNMFNFYPGKKVRVGDSWTTQGVAKMGMTMNIKATYTLESIKDGKAKLKVDSTLETDPESMIEMGPMKMQYDMKGPQEGFTVLDIKTGWVQNSAVNQTIDGVANVDMNGQSMEFPMKILSIVTMNPE